MTDPPARRRGAWAPAVLTALGVLAVSCGTGERQPPSAARPAAPAHVAAYDAGWRAGKGMYESGGKGTAVREVVWGGCARRSLTARPRRVVDRDRGAWVLGCRQGVSGEPHRPPAHAVTRRETDPGLLAGFRSWAARNGAEDAAAGAARVVLVRLGDDAYDVELTGGHDGGDGKADAGSLADAFTRWWDGDDGDAGVAWNLLILSPDGARLLTRDL
ncbi:hypothetical protein [Streptomyces naphthomycinicus]|uniref:hypothetical protein n=1 Tax=Streptomyces naphthomycinicus TaxID=2872625 RepID=UPI001CEC61CA|nr:hypothetical protein [Streptomyces sp. TML10]